MLSQIIISYICIYVKIIAFIFSDKLIAITNAKKRKTKKHKKKLMPFKQSLHYSEERT